MRRLLLLIALSPPGFAQNDFLARLATGDRWLAHLNQDLLPFWSMPEALGDPLGAFPSTRCDDGSVLVFTRPCPGNTWNSYLLTPARYLVPLSRQTYGYGVAFHMTGDARYLAWMKAGVDYIRRNAIDPAGGMFLTLNLNTGAWGPGREVRDPQQLGYGLLGLAFYYYLTRDDQVLPDILSLKNYIFDNYYNTSLGTMQWLLQSTSTARFDQKQLVADLDQMNTYLVLLTPILPEPYQAEWKRTMTTLSRSMLGTFYSPEDNLLFTGATTPQDRNLAFAGADFGHTAKALWMMRWAGQLTGDQGLFQFASLKARRHLERAYLEEDGSWAQAALRGGAIDKNKNWWIYAELDQLSGTMALADVSAGRYLPQTNEYWFQYFVDHQYGEVWNGVSYPTNSPQRDYPKAWQWKSAYHDFEHALVGYITAQQLLQRPAQLYYAFTRPVDRAAIRPYYFAAPVDAVEATPEGYQRVSFRAAPPPAAPALAAVSGASFLATPLAAQAIASAFGRGLAGGEAWAAATPLPTNLLGTTVTVRDSAGTPRPAPLFYVSPTQVNFQVPAGTPAGPAVVTVTAGGVSASGEAQIAEVAPSLFQSDLTRCVAAANVVRVHPDLSQAIEPVTAAPIDLGADGDQVYLSLFGTGLARARDVTVSLGGQNLPVRYAGPQGLAGLDQVNAGPIPRSLAGAGRLTLVLAAGGQTANPVEVLIR